MISTTGNDPTGILEPMDTKGGEVYHPSKEEQELNGLLQTKHDAAQAARAEYDDEIAYNQAVLRGDNIALRDSNSGEVIFVNITGDARRRFSPSDNIIRGINRALVGKHSRIIPGVQVTPASADESDIRAADAATSLLNHTQQRERMRKKWVKVQRLNGWSGTAVFELAWDREYGRALSWCPTCKYEADEDMEGEPCPACEMQAKAQSDEQFNADLVQYQNDLMQSAAMGGAPPPEPQRVEPEPAPNLMLVNEGDIRILVHSPRCFYPEPGVEEPEDMRWCFFKKATHVAEIRRMFPEMARYIKAESGITSHAKSAYPDTRQATELEDHAYLERWHERPSTAHPKGRLIFRACGLILNHGTHPTTGEEMLGEPSPYWKLGRIPAYMIRWERNDESIWGESHITQSSPQQRERNDMLRDMSDLRKMTGRPMLLVPQGSQLSKSDFYNPYPGKVVKFNAAQGKPGFLETPPFPDYMYNELERTRRACQDKASVTDQEMGMTIGEQSGRYASIMEAQSSEAVAPIIIENMDEYLEMHRAILILAQQYYSANRTWTIRGQDRYWTLDWASVDLRAGWDVTTVETDSLSHNPAIRLQQAQGLLEIGFFNDPSTGAPDMQRFARMAGLHDSSIGPDINAGERYYAAALPDLILSGQWPGPKPWDDVKLIAVELMGWLRGSGRSRPAQQQDQVGQVWMLYATYAAQQGITTQAEAQAMPNQIQQQQPQQQQPQQPSGMGGDGAGPGGVPGQPSTKPPEEEAAKMVKTADAEGEALARPTGVHEG